jgi:hypothetical protein
MALPGWFSSFRPKPDQGGNGEGNSSPTAENYQIVEVGDAPDLTRVMKPDPTCTGYYAESGYKTSKMIVASWSSLEVFASQFKGDNGSKWWARHNVRNSWSPEWNGTESFDAALDLAIHGWAEGGETIERTRGYIRALNPLSPRMQKYGIAGTTPNVPRAIAGNLLNMRVPEPGKSRKRQIMTLVYNMCENGGCSAESITNKAAVTAALVDEIEAKGFAVEVVAAVATNALGSGRSMIKAYEFVRIKESHHPMDINRIAFGLGHAAMFRGLFFADMQRNHEFKEIGEGLGSATSSFPTKELTEEQTYTITSAGRPGIPASLFKDVDTAVTKGLNAIVRELRLQDCPAFPKLKDHEDDLEQSEEEDERDYPPPEWSY